MTTGKQLHVNGPFAMKHGPIQSPTIAYETWGELNAARDNALLIFTGLSSSAHVTSSPEDASPGWWEDMVGWDKPVDTRRFFVICVNSLGSCFGSTGPASIEPFTGCPYRLTFPVLTLEDVASAGALVIDELGIDTLHTVIGPSMGGMTALAFTALFRGRAQRVIAISSASRSPPFSIALRSLQREMIRNDPMWLNGEYDPKVPPTVGMRLARKLGMISYRSAQEWDRRFGRERTTAPHQIDDPFGIDFEVEAYLENNANKFIDRFDANCYLYLSRAIDLFNLADHGGSLQAGLNRLALDSALVIGVATDILFPIHQQRELAEGLRAAGINTKFLELPSLQGHDAFMTDMDSFRPAIADYLS